MNPYAGGNGYHAQPTAPGAPGQTGPNGYPAPGGPDDAGTDAHDRTVNGGQYASVIREEGAAGSSPAASRPGQRAPGDGQAEPSRVTAPVAQPTSDPAPEVRAITATIAVPDGTAVSDGPSPAAQDAPGSVLAYGPDDPGYGPPGPDWYRQNAEEPVAAQTAAAPEADDEPEVIRSPFEPLVRADSGPARPGDGDAAARFDEPAGYAMSGYQPEDYAGQPGSPDVTDADRAGPHDGALGQLRSLYVKAERIRPETSDPTGDRQFDQLLERQRQLISEYFKESSGVEGSEPAGPRHDAAADGDPLVSFGTGQRGAW